MLLFEAFLFVSGNSYINATLADTIFKGRLGPGIEDYRQFPYREIKTGTHQTWKVVKNYNNYKLSEAQEAYMAEYQSVAFMVIQNDSILFEKYWDDIDENSSTNSFSAAKTIVSILIGVAIEEGKIKSVEDRLCDYLPEYCDSELGKQITLRDLLTMSSGINFDEDYINPFSFPAKSYYGYDLKGLIASYQPTDQPGKTWRYRGGDTQLLAFVVEAATGMSVGDYASQKLWQPIGAKNPAYWSLDVENGHEKASCCFNSNARDFARLGQLYLQGGKWNGKQLVDSIFVQESIKPATYLADEEGKQIDKYGYQWWTLVHKGLEVYYARGILGQYIFVIPQKNAVVVRLGHKRHKVKDDDHPQDVKKYLDFALEMM